MTDYIEEESLGVVFDFVERRYAKIEEVPRYRDEAGYDAFCGVLSQARSDSYPSLEEKATYLLIGINKGHFFSNGNKRLALVVTTIFLGLNNLQLKGNETKEWYKTLLTELFPEYERWEDFDEFTATDFATYNLSIMIADSGVYGISHDELKRRINVFISTATEPFVFSV